MDMVPGAPFEVMLDSGSATLIGRMQGDDEIFVVKDGFEPFLIGSLPPFQFMSGHRAGEDRTIPNLPPGTYRVIAVGRDYMDETFRPEDLAQRLARAQKIVLQSNETKSIDVKE